MSASSKPGGPAAPPHPSLFVFSSVLEVGAKSSDHIKQAVRGHKGLGEKPRTIVAEALTDCEASFRSLGSSLDSLHLALVDSGSSSTLPHPIEEKLASASTSILGTSTKIQEVTARQNTLRKSREQTDSIVRDFKRLEQKISDTLKLNAQYDKAVEQATVRANAVTELETELADCKKKSATLEQSMGEMRKTLQETAQQLRQDLDKAKAARKSVSQVQKQLDEKRVRKQELAEKCQTLQAMFYETDEGAFFPDEGETHISENEAPTTGQLSLNNFFCVVCSSSSNLVLLIPCMDSICITCIKQEMFQAERHNREFKYHVCPNCDQTVESLDGEGLMAVVEKHRETGEAKLEFPKKSWKRVLCADYGSGHCILTRKECPFAHGASDVLHST